MKIKTVLFLSIVFLIGVIIFASVIFISLSQATQKAVDQRTRASEIVKNITDLRLLTFDYALHHEERARIQWELQYKSLANLLSQIDLTQPTNRAILGDIRRNYTDIKSSFLMITKNVQSVELDGNQSVRQELITRLTEQLLTKSQEMITGALSLVTISESNLKQAQERANIFVLLIAALLCLLISDIYFLFRRRVIQPLQKLQEGTVKIAEGNFSYRVDIKGHDEIAELAKSFNTMTARLEEIDSMKSEFISLAAHQLRTPLNSLRWNIEILLNQNDTASPKEVKQKLQTIYESSLRLVALSDNLLNISRIEKRYIVPIYEDVDISELIISILAEYSKEAKQQSLKISYTKILPKKSLISLDRYLVTDILRNLVSNAIKYSNSGGTIDIHADVQGDNFLLEISDLGIGIPTKDQKNIFTKFFRASNATLKDANISTGLGLFVTKSYIKILGGQISFESEENKGTTFSVKIPIGKPKS